MQETLGAMSQMDFDGTFHEPKTASLLTAARVDMPKMLLTVRPFRLTGKCDRPLRSVYNPLCLKSQLVCNCNAGGVGGLQ